MVNRWVGILGDYLIGPLELPRIFNEAVYYNVLINTFSDEEPLLQKVEWFLHDSAPPHI